MSEHYSEKEQIQYKKDFEGLCNFFISQGFEEDNTVAYYLKNTFRLFYKHTGGLNQKLEIQVDIPMGDYKGGVSDITHDEKHTIFNYFTIIKVETFKMLIENNCILRRYFAF